MEHLPFEVLLIIALWLDPIELGALSQVSRVLHHFVENLGWRAYVTSNLRYSQSLSKTIATWSPREHARFIHFSDRNWNTPSFVARPLLRRPWPRWQHPVMAINTSHIIVSHGPELQVYDFGHMKGPMVRSARNIAIQDAPTHPSRDITGIAVLPPRGEYEASRTTICISRMDGSLARVVLPAVNDKSPGNAVITALYSPHPMSAGSGIKCLASSGNMLLTLHANGTASLYNALAPWTPPSLLRLPDRARLWSAFISLSSSIPFAAIGASTPAPLSIYPIEDRAFGNVPLANLGDGLGIPLPSAVYATSQPDPHASSFPWGSSNQIILSGWYDGVVRVHDLRDSTRIYAESPATTTTSTPLPLMPVLTLSDSTSLAGPIYSLATGGGHGAHVVAGTAMHGVVSIWDARSPSTGSTDRARQGWSVYPPNADWSPTYSLLVEGSRIWGAGRWGPFILDFSPDLRPDSFPSLDMEALMHPAGSRRSDRYRSMREDGLGFHSTTYDHNVQRRTVVVQLP